MPKPSTSRRSSTNERGRAAGPAHADPGGGRRSGDRHLPRHAAGAGRHRVAGGHQRRGRSGEDAARIAQPGAARHRDAGSRRARSLPGSQEGPADARGAGVRGLGAPRQGRGGTRAGGRRGGVHPQAVREPGIDRADPRAAQRLTRRSGYSFFSPSSAFGFFCLAAFFSPAPCLLEAASVFFSSPFFSGDAFCSGAAFSDFSTSSRIDIGALSPRRFWVWMIRVYPPGRALKRGPMVSNSLARAASVFAFALVMTRSTTRRASFALGVVVRMLSSRITARIKLSSSALRWLVLRLSLRPVLAWRDIV